MKIAMKDGNILIKEADSTQFTIIKSWGKMKWSRNTQTLQGTADIETLNKLASIIKLPEIIEKERRRLNKILEEVNKGRLNEHPEYIVRQPVKVRLFKHQVRGYNMALLTLELVELKDSEEKDRRKTR